MVIDGCEIGCAKAVLEQAEVPVRTHLVITDLGIQKNKNLNPIREEVDLVKQAARKLSGSTAAGGITNSGNFCTCGSHEKESD